MKLLAVGLALFGLCTLSAADTADAVLSRLAHVNQFAFGGIGYAGVTSPGEKDYKLILVRPTAMADFEKLLSSGNPQAKAYALVGIRKLNPRRFKEAVQPVRDSKDEVVTERGCIVDHETMRAIAGQIEDGRYSKY